LGILRASNYYDLLSRKGGRTRMSKKLLIVESPAKVKTIGKVLGRDYTVLASYGHVRDLPPKDGSIDVDNGFAARYEVIDRNSKYVDQIVKAARDVDEILLATDLDREGEAISWHISEVLKEKKQLRDLPMSRVTFAEITPKAIKDAILHPRPLNMDLVNSQQARRALDYLVGFKLSPVLWMKVQRGLSAGRVQSPTLRMIVDREDEIERFVAQEYWTIEASLNQNGAAFPAKLTHYQNAKLEQFDLHETGAANAARDELEKQARSQGKGPIGALKVLDIQRKDRLRRPAPPFITSTLQQEAARKLGFGAQRTMRVAQALYEGIAIDEGQVGLISYMRTDSVNLSNDALADLRETIARQFGQHLLPAAPVEYKSKSKNAQEAHEAIRPSSAARTPASIRKYLKDDEYALYELIWKRTLACQMKPAVLNTVAVDLACGVGNKFRANGSTVVEAGFLTVYEEGRDVKSEDDESGMLPVLTVGELIPMENLVADQHFTEPPPRYSEATLVKAMEEIGIGRPSTYASTVQVLLAREYVTLENKRFYPTDVGKVVSRFLAGHFTQYVDYDFTAKLEDELDAVSRGEESYIPVLERFWKPFKALIDEKTETVSRAEASSARVLGLDPLSGKEVSVRIGRFGPFVQIGTKDDEEKPKFASLRPGQKMDSVSFDDAMKLFDLPRKFGPDHQGREITIAIGRFGPFAKVGAMYVSLGKEDDPYTISLERTIELIQAKEAANAARTIKTFNDGAIQVLQGKYGPYITDGQKNGKIPKGMEATDLSLEDCVAALEAAPATRPKNSRAAAKNATERAKRDVAARRGKSATVKVAKSASKKSKLASSETAVTPPVKKVAVKKATAKKAAAKKAATKKTVVKKAGATKTVAKKAAAKKVAAARKG
jgi:DNA topoisomerase I